MRTTLRIIYEGSAQVTSLIGFTQEQTYWVEAFARYLDGAEICVGTVVTGEFDVYYGAMRYDEFRELMVDIGYENEVEQADLEGCIS